MSFAYQSARRRFLAGLAGAGAVGLFAPRLSEFAFAQDGLTPTPACEDGDDPTPAQTPGPFYLPDSPRRANLREEGMAGVPIVLTGTVLSRSCRTIPNALVDLWQADDAGRYDVDGARLRGHQFTDADGRYRFETILPGLYPGRTRHFHVRYQAPNIPVLTTQLYLPDEPANRRDRLFRPELLVRLVDAPGATARFDTVLDLP
jgi:protocatechuate 3,4-dioxygenase beta subunit